MRQRDINRPKQEEMTRLKDILFPKKVKSRIVTKEEESQQLQNQDNGVWMRSEISRLRGQICNLLQKGKNRQTGNDETERAYLDGINKLSKGLKNYTFEINQVFEDFMAYLPIASNVRKNFSNDYYLSLLVQNSVWTKIQKIMKQPIALAFKSILEEANFNKQQTVNQLRTLTQRQNRYKNRLFSNVNKYFNKWRYNNMCIKVNKQTDEYLKQNSLQFDKKLEQSLLNLSLLTCMLEEYGKESADCIEILIIDQKQNKACKFIQDGMSCLNSSLQTITQRSLAQSENGKCKFKRYQFAFNQSLTKNCIKKGEILFITNLFNNPDYSEIDNSCSIQNSKLSNNQYLKGGAIFYPLFDSHHQCVGILRQYFFEGAIKTISSIKMQKINMLLELGLNIDKKMRLITRQRDYQKQGYYLKMITLIKKMQLINGSDSDLMNTLQNELKQKIGASKLSIYKIQRRQKQGIRDILLQNIYGESQQCTFLLSLVDQLMKQESNHVYLEKRLLIYSKMMLFDLSIDQKMTAELNDRLEQEGNKILPVQLIVNAITKIQNILARKQEENKTKAQLQQQLQQQKQLFQEKLLQQNFKRISLAFISNNSDSVLTGIKKYLRDIWMQVNSTSSNVQQLYVEPVFYLQCNFKKSKRDKTIIQLGTKDIQIQQDIKAQWMTFFSSFLKIIISDILILFIDFKLTSKSQIIYNDIIDAIRKYVVNKFNVLKQQKQINWSSSINIKAFFKEKNDHCAQLSISRQQNKQLELEYVQSIFNSFNQIVTEFCQMLFQSKKDISWQKQRPCKKNIEEWKQMLYKFALAKQEDIQIQIINKNQIISVSQYQQLKLITNYQFSSLESDCWLVINHSQNQYKSKSFSNDNQLLIKLPIYYSFSQDVLFSLKTSEIMLELKNNWIILCKSLLKRVLHFNQGLKNKSMKIMWNCLQIIKYKNTKTAFKIIEKNRLMKLKYKVNVQELKKVLNKIKQSFIWHSFINIKANNQFQAKRKNQNYLDSDKVNSMMKILSKQFLSTVFSTLKKYVLIKQRQQIGFTSMQAIYNKIIKQTKKQIISDIYYFTHQNSYSDIIISLMKSLILKRQNMVFKQIKQNDCYKPEIKTNYEGSHLIDKCTSLKDIQQFVRTQTPLFHLYKIIDQSRCFTIYSPQQKFERIVNIQEVNFVSSPYIMYEVGNDCQLIWLYCINEGENCFKLKDKLNSLSKTMNLGIKNCQHQFQVKLSNLFFFKKKFIKFLKQTAWKNWKYEIQKIGMQERNRLNDSLYQISVESQTMRQKLKSQQKALKSNYSIFQQLQNKQQSYNKSINFCQQKVVILDQSRFKLDNTRTIYNSLHQRTVVKSCLMLWRNNSLNLALNQYKAKTKQTSTCFKLSLNSIFDILSNILKSNIRQAIDNIRKEKKKIPSNKKEIQKILVSFQQSNNRLITFQTDLQQQQNSNDYSNREYSPDKQKEKQNVNIPNKLKIEKLNQNKKNLDLSAQEMNKYSNGAYKLNPKTLKFLKRMGKLQN